MNLKQIQQINLAWNPSKSVERQFTTRNIREKLGIREQSIRHESQRQVHGNRCICRHLASWNWNLAYLLAPVIQLGRRVGVLERNFVWVFD